MNDDFGKICERAIRLLTERMPSAEKLIKPTLFHNIRVGTYLYQNDYSDEIVLAGFLHDALEDTDISDEVIRKSFGDDVADMVLANTKNPLIKEKKERNQELLTRCAGSGNGSIIVKMADILDNYLYYERIQSEEGLEYCFDNTKYLLTAIPGDFQDKTLERLKKVYIRNQ